MIVLAALLDNAVGLYRLSVCENRETEGKADTQAIRIKIVICLPQKNNLGFVMNKPNVLRLSFR